jgi:hypothetical protein
MATFFLFHLASSNWSSEACCPTPLPSPLAILVGLYGPYTGARFNGIHELFTHSSETTNNETQQNLKTL